MVITSILGLIGVFLARPIVDGASGAAEEILHGNSVKAKLAR